MKKLENVAIANALQNEAAEPRQPFAALITTPCQVWSRSAFCCWHITLRCDGLLTSDPVTLTVDLWPWTFAAYRLWRDETLHQIWTQSNNLRRSYCECSVWPYDLEHVLSVAHGSGIIFTKFDLRQLYPCLNYSVFMLIRYVTLWSSSSSSSSTNFIATQVLKQNFKAANVGRPN